MKVISIVDDDYGIMFNNRRVSKVTATLLRKGFSYSDIKSAYYRIENEE